MTGRETDDALEAVREKLRRGPAARAPSRFGRPGGLARRLVLRAIRPFSHHQRELDAKVLEALQGLGAMVAELEARVAAVESRLIDANATEPPVVTGDDLGTVPLRQTRYLGHPFVYPYDNAIGFAIEHGQEWDAVLRTEVSELLPMEQPSICEVGSNIGASLMQILAGKPRARVVAFEPSDRFLPFLECNLQLAGVDRVEIIRRAAGRRPGSMWLYRNTTTATLVDSERAPAMRETFEEYASRGKERVEVTTIDEVFAERDRLDFIKVDADGFDLEVLRGAEATLLRDRPILHFELTPVASETLGLRPVEDLGWLQGLDYQRFVCLTPEGKALGATEDPGQVWAWAEEHRYCDVVTCSRGSEAEARLGEIEL